MIYTISIYFICSVMIIYIYIFWFLIFGLFSKKWYELVLLFFSGCSICVPSTMGHLSHAERRRSIEAWLSVSTKIWVFPKIGSTPKSSHFNRVFRCSIINFTIHFGGSNPPIFGSTSIFGKFQRVNYCLRKST